MSIYVHNMEGRPNTQLSLASSGKLCYLMLPQGGRPKQIQSLYTIEGPIISQTTQTHPPFIKKMDASRPLPAGTSNVIGNESFGVGPLSHGSSVVHS